MITSSNDNPRKGEIGLPEVTLYTQNNPIFKTTKNTRHAKNEECMADTQERKQLIETSLRKQRCWT